MERELQGRIGLLNNIVAGRVEFDGLECLSVPAAFSGFPKPSFQTHFLGGGIRMTNNAVYFFLGAA